MTADHSSRPSALRRVDSKTEKSASGARGRIPCPPPRGICWRDAPRIAVIGIFILLLGAFLYAARTLIAPIVAAAVRQHHVRASGRARGALSRPAGAGRAGLRRSCHPGGQCRDDSAGWRAGRLGRAGAGICRDAQREGGLPRTAAGDVARAAAVACGGAGTSVEPIKFELPAKEVISQVVNFLTPAVGELVVFFGSLFFFLLSRNSQRQTLVLMFKSQDARLRALRILNALEANLTRYLLMVSAGERRGGNGRRGHRLCVRTAKSGIVGRGCVHAELYPVYRAGDRRDHLAGAWVDLRCRRSPAALLRRRCSLRSPRSRDISSRRRFVGRQLTVSPLALFLSLAFWTWLWGPLGTFLATPILIAPVVIQNHTRIVRQTSNCLS